MIRLINNYRPSCYRVAYMYLYATIDVMAFLCYYSLVFWCRINFVIEALRNVHCEIMNGIASELLAI